MICNHFDKHNHLLFIVICCLIKMKLKTTKGVKGNNSQMQNPVSRARECEAAPKVIASIFRVKKSPTL